MVRIRLSINHFPMIGDKKENLQDDLKSCLFTRGIGIFDLIFLSHILPKIRSFCAHQKGNFLNFLKLTLLSSLVHSWCPLWPVKHKRAFFLGHPVCMTEQESGSRRAKIVGRHLAMLPKDTFKRSEWY